MKKAAKIKNLKFSLFDSPGIVLTDVNSHSGKILLQTVSGNVTDNRAAAIEILNRCGDTESLAFHYQLEVSPIVLSNPDGFIAALARRKGFLKKGARPDANAACRFLIKEWTAGRLNFHTMPPETESTEASKITTCLGDELDEEMLFLGKTNDMDTDSSEKIPNLLLDLLSDNLTVF